MEKVIVNDFFEMNCYIVSKNESCFVVDPGGAIDIIKAKIANLKVEFVLLTHGHFDHIDGLGLFTCPIYIHSNDFDMIFDPYKASYTDFGIKPSYNVAMLDIRKINDGDEISFLDEKVRVIHTSGHTKGSCCFLYKDKLFSGDTLFKQSIGRTDLFGGSDQDMKKSLVKLIDSLDDNIKVYPGHDEQTTIKDERKNNNFYLTFKKSMR